MRVLVATSDIARVLDENIGTGLGLSMRSKNGLLNAGIKTIRDLVQSSPSALLKTKNFGRVSLREVLDALAARGLEMGVRVLYQERSALRSPEVARVVAALDAVEGLATEDLEKIAALPDYLRLLKLSHLSDRQAATMEGAPPDPYVALARVTGGPA